MPKRIQRQRTKGWKMPPNTVSVTRPGKWGNPWRVGINRCSGHGIEYQQEKVVSARMAVQFFREMLAYPDRAYPSNGEIVRQLSGKDLACFCPLIDRHGNYSPCHADVLLSIANDIPMDEVISENIRWAEREAAR